MDYQEAIECLIKECQHRIDVITDFMEGNKDADKDKCLRNIEMYKTDISAMQELLEYKKIGTLEEVREAVEKQKQKKPIIQQWSPARCPACGEELSESLGDGYYRHRTFLERCTNVECAQRLDWSEEE